MDSSQFTETLAIDSVFKEMQKVKRKDKHIVFIRRGTLPRVSNHSSGARFLILHPKRCESPKLLRRIKESYLLTSFQSLSGGDHAQAYC